MSSIYEQKGGGIGTNKSGFSCPKKIDTPDLQSIKEVQANINLDSSTLLFISGKKGKDNWLGILW